MPPEQNKNNNIPLDTFKVGGIDPVFKGNPNSTPTPGFQGMPSQTIPQQTANGAYGILKNQVYTPTTPPVVTAQVPPENKPLGPKSIVRTYKSDLETAIEAGHMSSINIAIAENKKMHEKIQAEPVEVEETTSTSEYSKSKIIILISVILVIAGLAGIFALFFLGGSNSTQTIVTQELPSLITTEYKDELLVNNVNAGNFANILSTKLNDVQTKVNNFDNVYITVGSSSAKRLITATEFVTLMKFKIPDILKRTLLPDFMVGMYSFGTNLPFVILKTSYFENAYTGMLDWEKDLEEDFQVLFRFSGYKNSGNILQNLTPTVYKKFTDAVIINKDVRVLRDNDGQIIFLYAIIDKETIIFTVNDTAFKEIVNRLNKEKGLKR